jgi:hypothetical protein
MSNTTFLGLDPAIGRALGHLTWNIVTMLGWCVPLERALGSARFSAIYLGAAVAASGLSVVIHDGVSAGASGAGYGVVGAHLALATRRAPTWSAFFRGDERHVEVTVRESLRARRAIARGDGQGGGASLSASPSSACGGHVTEDYRCVRRSVLSQS